MSNARLLGAAADSLTEVGVGEAPKRGALYLISGQLSTDLEPQRKELG
jgi:hypothetical protein